MDSGTTEHLRAVKGLAADDLFVAGESGTILHRDGSAWSAMNSATGFNLFDIWVSSPTLAYGVGDHGTVVVFDGAAWVPRASGVTDDSFYAVWGSSPDDVYLVGSRSTAIRWTGLQFKAVTIDLADIHNFHDIVGGGPSDIYIASEYIGPASLPAGSAATSAALHAGGLIFHWDGASWQPVYQDPVHDVLSVWRDGNGRGVACGNASSILVDDGGGSWARVWDLQGLPFSVNFVRGSSARNVFVVGDSGTITRYSP
jgi:photosystem II stability/assembly factor-like uncharacterized protein